jgi:hypothetical protein
MNANNPGVRENAQKNIDRMKANRQKRHRSNTKRKNLGTANLLDFDEAGQKRIQEQVLNAMGSRDVVSNHTHGCHPRRMQSRSPTNLFC